MLENMDLGDYINKFSDVLKVFIKNACNIYLLVTSQKQKYSFAKLIEHFLSLKNSRCLPPLSLHQNIVIYSCAQSKTVFQLIGSVSPSGSYNTYYEWFDKLSYDKLKFPSGLIVAAFDNNQVIGKTYNISQQGNLPTSIVTTVCYAQYLEYENLINTNYKKKWLDNVQQKKELDKYANNLVDKMTLKIIAYVRN